MSVLDEMTSRATMAKQEKAGLTPVGLEKGGPLARLGDVPGVMLAPEALRDIARDLRTQAQMMLDIATGIDAMLGEPEATKADVKAQMATEVKLMEREGDRQAADREAADKGDKAAAVRALTAEAGAEASAESFTARMERLSAQAQAATFADAPAETVAAGSASPVKGWVCPVHGGANLKQLHARKSGRDYQACQSCLLFEK